MRRGARRRGSEGLRLLADSSADRHPPNHIGLEEQTPSGLLAGVAFALISWFSNAGFCAWGPHILAFGTS